MHETSKTKNKLKLGLALGSGGAKGLAHIGALRAFEEENIKFDVVCGSSIGAVVGGLYAGGASSKVMWGIIDEFDIRNMRKLLEYKIKGFTIEKLLDHITGGVDIEDLNIPYGASAVDLDTGKEVWMTSGNLAKAICASSAIPPFFKVASYDGKRYGDGSYLNAVPADLARSLGADVVIGINITGGKYSNEDLKKSLDRFVKDNKVPIADRMTVGLKYSDIMLDPNVKNFSTIDFKRFDEIDELGYIEAREKMPLIKELLKSKGL